MARASLLFAEQARILDGDACFASQNAHQLQMAFVEHTLLQTVRDHHTDGAIVKNQRHAAEAPHALNRFDSQAANLSREVFADEQGLTGADHVFREVVPHGPRPLGQA